MPPSEQPERPDDALSSLWSIDRVIDSWRVHDGTVIGMRAHAARFEDAVEDVFVSRMAIPADPPWEDIWASVAAATPAEGEFFPRMTAALGEDGDRLKIEHELRRAPERRPTTSLAVAPDTRTHPTVKGADLETLASLREVAVELGDDDALLVDDRGNIVEAANGAILAWRDGQLVRPASERLLPSVTVVVLTGLLRRRGEDLRRVRIRLEDADELWYVNALHGISPVRSVDGEERPVDEARAARWQATLEAQRQPL
ncbi:aminotransferase class IV [Pseudoclavibacter chungangensis]|uniref:Aminotransferase class IV n=1 Tax=Pseudoclavibacter chungangensis TaxID=587635 RepID=A0A7J5BR46_9MICO|nr:aminotransferase class IV [Pseudoclavibacter chungangensis]KAB1656694.1 aminotransferase class IV [Pseudoclavibacter chungangensis]NYJ67852.1 branched-subunit amino acid aminotransferase/4-amino-4-deoxychorismate lyase [Pseudoclavibacter chungangensis]